MFAILTDKKGFHKVVDLGYQNVMRPLRVIRFAVSEQYRPIAPIEDPAQLQEMNELTFRLERQVNVDTFLYREEWTDET
jgi:hypothetical protein